MVRNCWERGKTCVYLEAIQARRQQVAALTQVFTSAALLFPGI